MNDACSIRRSTETVNRPVLLSSFRLELFWHSELSLQFACICLGDGVSLNPLCFQMLNMEALPGFTRPVRVFHLASCHRDGCRAARLHGELCAGPKDKHTTPTTSKGHHLSIV